MNTAEEAFVFVCVPHLANAPQAEKTTRKAHLADRLVNGLSGENKRWSETIKKMDVTGGKLVSKKEGGGEAIFVARDV